ncbi:hypothetical protein NGM36_15460 [Streptomyces mutabilis]|uniref:hypothetical protein n=1 Tax=Streptomyces mutabilis TaxID=67332 RepID=UPI0022BA3B3B|nr:hypothetical protein [Streptomyces mutabilis]MCZ9351176.1 hypothetical protein [Streptomyces mutabilis]
MTESEMREAAGRHDATVNDASLGGMAVALGHWYRSLSPSPARTPDLSVLIPMSLRQDRERYAVGTRISAHQVDLPCQSQDLGQAVRRVHRQTLALRTHRVRDASRLALSLLPVALGHRMAGVVLGATSARLFTSSITLPADFTCLGGRLSAASMISDLFSGRLCYVSFTRAAGVVRCGIVADEALPGASALPGLWRDALGVSEQTSVERSQLATQRSDVA